MSYCIIIRGPAGVGKTTIAKELSNYIFADYISFDEIMSLNKLDIIVGDGIPSENFVKANEIVITMIKNKTKVVLDGCFYRKEQIDHLLKNLKSEIIIFTLNATLAECLERNKYREHKLSDENIEQVYLLVSKLKLGILINTSGKNSKQVVLELLNHINF